MSSMSVASLPSNLQTDIWWRIFDLIAHTRVGNLGTQDIHASLHPLATVQSVSHVCSGWRSLVLASSSIWGAMIDMDIMGRLSESWRDEIMTRTGDSELTIYGRVSAVDKTTRLFFISLLTDHWSRIKELDVEITQSDLINRAVWNVFWKYPAKHLVYFRVTFAHLTGYLDNNDSDEILFADCAPSLQVFACDQLGFNPRATWIPQLRVLTVSSSLAVSEVFDMLKQAPHLQELNLVRQLLPVGDHLPDIQPIRLPYLRKLTIHNTFQTCMAFLSNIIIDDEQGCELSIRAINGFDVPIEVEDINLFRPIFVEYAQRFFSSRKVLYLRLGTGSNYFGFYIHFLGDQDDTVLHSEVNIFYGIPFPPTIHSLLLNSLSTCNLASVKVFKLSMVSNQLSRDIDYEDVNFHALVYALPSVETLFVTEWAIKLLNDPTLDQTRVFPFMKELKLEHFSSLLSRTFPSTMTSFLLGRQEISQPIEVLDISDYASRFSYDWRFLDDIEGLRVVWNADGMHNEYIGGSGCRDKLLIERKRL